MKSILKCLCIFTIAVFMAFLIYIPTSANQDKDITILFTSDLHSHFLPENNSNGGQSGGYARLKTEIDNAKSKYPNAILVDGGDFSMGSLFQTAYTTSVLELRLMGAMGYDVTTFGNHEFDYMQSGLASMLNAAVASGEKLPEIVNSNYLPPVKTSENYTETTAALQSAMDNYGVKKYTVIEKDGVLFAVFGIFGFDADTCAPNSGMVLGDPADIAQITVDEAIKYCKDTYGKKPVVVCLSHGGTSQGKGEDYDLAKSVNGIDVIISGHTHTTLDKPITVNNTIIASCGDYGANLGVINLSLDSDNNVQLKDYRLIPIDETIPENAEIADRIESFKLDVENNYLSKYNLNFDDILVKNNYTFDTVDQVYATQHESTLCNLFADAYKWAVEKTTGEPVDFAVTASGVIRDSLPVGDITVSSVFNAASLGVGTEGELVKVYLNGKEIKSALEIDASVQPLMKSAQLFSSGVEYSYNTKRMIFNKVDYAKIRKSDLSVEDIDDNKLYCVVTGMYCGEMLGSVEETSFGLISIIPKDKNGNPIDMNNLSDYVVKDDSGTPLKEWYAIASYLKEMDGEIDERYAAPDGRKVVYSSLNPIKLLRNANKFTYFALAFILIAAVIFALIIKFIFKRIKLKHMK